MPTASSALHNRGLRLDRRRRLALFALASVLAVCLSACQVTLHIGIDVRRDGSGTVTVTAQLDQPAAATVPNLARDLRTSDLVKAGWRVKGPAGGPNGSVTVMASKPFSNPAGAKAIVAELSGVSGPFRDLEIVRQPSLFSTRTTFRASVDLSCGLGCFADPQLQQELGGRPDLGLDATKLQTDTGIDLTRLFQFETTLRLPGSVQSTNAPVQLGDGAHWPAKLGDSATLVASSRAWNVGNIAAIVGALLLLSAVVALFVHPFRWNRRRDASTVTPSP